MKKLVIVLLIMSCGQTQEEEACHDLLRWIGNYAERCYGPGTREQVVPELEKQMECYRVIAISDRELLYGACYTNMLHMSCVPAGEKPPMPASCEGQLLIGPPD